MHPDLLNNSVFLKYYRQWQEDASSVVFAPIAEFFIRYGMLDEAMDVCREGLKRRPDFISGRVVMAKVHIKRGETEKARQLLCQILVSSPSNESARNLLTEISGGVVGQAEEKVQSQATTVLPQVAVDNKELSHLPESLDNAENSPAEEGDLDPGLNFNEDSALGEVKTPVYAALASATARVPSWETVTMANIYLAQGHVDRARGIYESILLRDPTNEQARRGLEEIARMGG